MKKRSWGSLAAMALMLGAVVISNPSLREPVSFARSWADTWTTFLKSPTHVDEPFATDEPSIMELIYAARMTASKFTFVPFSHVWEPLIIEMALPKIYVPLRLAAQENPRPTMLEAYGPQPRAERLDQPHPYWERWGRMLLALFCWIGATCFFRRMALSFRVLWGVWITGWGLALVSWVCGLPLSRIYFVWVPLTLAGTGYLFLRWIREMRAEGLGFAKAAGAFKVWIRKRAGVFALLGIFPHLWMPFVLGPLRGPDARSMWFYRYKFEFFVGFVPDWIARYMLDSAQRDYPWFLGGSVGIASFLERHSFGGWNENAAYGSLIWLVLATMFLWWKFLERIQPVYRMALLAMTFFPLARYINNGYMDGLWIPLFALFLFGYLTDRFKRGELWLLLACACSLKNEAIASLVVLLAGVGIAGIARHGVPGFVRAKGLEIALWLSACSLTILQKLYLQLFYGIVDQYRLGQRLHELPMRDIPRRFAYVHRFLGKHVFRAHPEYLVPVLLIAVLALFRGKIREGLGRLGLLYAFALPMIFIYTYTPHEQRWQLETSAGRVFMIFPFYAALVVGLLLERRGEKVQLQRPAKGPYPGH